ncbi:MAG: hypothetical protein J4432_04440 [DPANN group archaeon]|nr:hypothetical protein [DPANN group archaeon]
MAFLGMDFEDYTLIGIIIVLALLYTQISPLIFPEQRLTFSTDRYEISIPEDWQESTERFKPGTELVLGPKNTSGTFYTLTLVKFDGTAQEYIDDVRAQLKQERDFILISANPTRVNQIEGHQIKYTLGAFRYALTVFKKERTAFVHEFSAPLSTFSKHEVGANQILNSFQVK